MALPLSLIYLAAAWHCCRSQPDGVELAYIGPGAGIALLGSFLAVFAATLSAIAALLTWPVRWVWRTLRARQAMARARVPRVVILGLDGLDPELAERFIAEGLLPNFARLREEGTFARLGTTCPALSPVAWSSFSTGTNPGKHNIFDFLSRNPANYAPIISSVQMRQAGRALRLGRYRIPLSRTRITNRRKSKPFWNVLSEAGVFSAVLRVPITFPPDRFRGVQLSAMCVPDLRGTQGTFTYFTEDGQGGMTTDGDVGGERVVVQRNGNCVRGLLPGPDNPLREDAARTGLPIKVTGAGDGAAVLHAAGQRIPLRPNCYSDWVRVAFALAPGVKVRGVCRFYMKSFAAPFRMYCTPVHIDPERPVMPISHPRVYSIYLAKLLGPYATLGLAEDTWSLSEGVIGEDAFLKQTYDIHREREQMFFDALRRVRRGMVACVFDASDRIQHMFWRFHEADHPARGDPATAEANRHAIRDMYVEMDKLLGRTLAAVGKDTALMVMSDHGFKPFGRGVDLNAWLKAHGYLNLKDDADSSESSYLADIDWSRTRAYAIGLAGIYVNQRGREAEGIVAPGHQKRELLEEIRDGLTGLCDPAHNRQAVSRAVIREDVYTGPYVEAAPDLIVGCNAGYRVSWDAAIGKCAAEVFSDNTKAWSGDHCIDPALVPGVLFSNLKLDARRAKIIDLAPTTLALLGVDKPPYMEGKSLLCADETS